MLEYWLWLVMTMGVGSAESKIAIQNCPDIQKLYHLMHDPSCTFLNPAQKKRVGRIPLEQAESILHYCEKMQFRLMTYYDSNYPEQLRTIYNPPVLLFYQGDPNYFQSEHLLTVVGTRHPSDYSIRTAQQLCRELAAAGCTLVSGCAVGLDTIVHQSAIIEQKPTVAVLGCGLDCNYPRGSRPLKEKIIENGLIITEFFPGTPPYGSNFPVRNRILAGLSQAVLIIEAGKESGCMITADHACEQGKSVYCIPPADIYHPRYAGQIELLREGAFCLMGSEDLFAEKIFDQPAEEPEEEPEKQNTFPDLSAPEIPEPESAPEEESEMLSADEQKLLEALHGSEKNVNMICCLTGMTFSAVSMHLAELEMMGWIVCCGRDFYKTTEKYKANSST